VQGNTVSVKRIINTPAASMPKQAEDGMRATLQRIATLLEP
jgi:hypothetical protein